MSMDEENNQILDEFSILRNHTSGSATEYRAALKRYSKYNQLSLKELLREAEEEERNGILWKNRKIKQRLIKYRQNLYETYKYNTAKSRLSRILTFYRHFEIELQDLPSISTKNVNKNQITFKDLPTRKIIKKAVKFSNPMMRAIILFMSSSGTARAETLSLTIRDFIEATSEYHNLDNIYSVLNILKDRNDVIPTFYLRRKKVNEEYFTFCSPEATSAIVDYLISETRQLYPDSPLFKINKQTFSENFQEIDIMLYGEEGYYGSISDNSTDEFKNQGNARRKSKFTSHMLRRWHATTLSGEGMREIDINALQGRKVQGVISSYVKINPKKLRETYIEYMKHLTINLDVNNLDLKSPEFVQLETELQNKETEIDGVKEELARFKIEINNKFQKMLQKNEKFSLDDFDFVE